MRLILGDEELELCPERAVFWPAQQALFIADLHLGKPELFQARGVPVPASSSLQDLEVLERLIARVDPTEVWILGDFVHHHQVANGAAWQRFGELRQCYEQIDFHLIRGNHDRRLVLPDSWRMVDHEEPYKVGPWELRHYPSENNVPRMAGHLHPTVTVRSARDAMRLPCFYLEGRQLILPAFTSFSAGVDMAGRTGRTFAIVDSFVMEV